MNEEKLACIIQTISKGDTGAAELLFSRPGGRKYFESLIAVVISNLPYGQDEKADLFIAFRTGLDKIEKRIRHQKEGQEILKQINP